MSDQIKNAQILIVEDFDSMRHMITSVLEMDGFSNLRSVSNGWYAKEFLEKNTPAMVISGWDMPKASGLQLLKAIRKNKRLANLPFLMLTTRADRDSVVQAVEEGVDAYLLKPFRFKNLTGKVAELVDSAYVPAPIEERLEKIVQHIETTSIVPNFTQVEKQQAEERERQREVDPDQVAAAIPQAQADQSEVVLIVDDIPSNIDVIAGILKDTYKTKVAINGYKALEIARENPPDMILLDIMMPGMDGYEVCQRLKADEATAGIPVMFVSAKNDTVDITKGFETGAVDYMTKPVIPEILLAKLKTHIGMAKALKR